MNRDIFYQKALDLAKQVWHIYILEPTEEGISYILSLMSDNMIVIGTGKHEFYQNLQSFISGMEKDQQEAQDISFEILDEWYSVQEITSDVCIVYGTLWVREKTDPAKAVQAEMDTRFTMVLQNMEDKICIRHIHQSIPYIDQAPGEYYPKTILALANEAIERARHLEHGMERDYMTGLYNRYYAEQKLNRWLKQFPDNGVFYMMDLDQFKQINDELGHLQGDEVIRAFAAVLRQVFPDPILVGRLGGDEFFAFFPKCAGKAEAEQKAQELIHTFAQASVQHGNLSLSCSVGMATPAACGSDFHLLYQAADRALYQAKGQGKGTWAWADECS